MVLCSLYINRHTLEKKNIGNDKVTFEQAYFEWVEYKKKFARSNNSRKAISETTITRYIRDYNSAIAGTTLASMPIKTMTPMKLFEALEEIICSTYYSTKKDKRDHSNGHRMYQAAASNIIGYVTNALHYAYMCDRIERNPMDKLDKDLLISLTDPNPVDSANDSERVLTISEMESLWDAVRRHEEAHPLYTTSYAIELALMTGMRVGELSALHWSDISDVFISVDYSEQRIDHADGTSHLEIGEPKCRKHRRIPVSNEMRQLFDKILSIGIDSEFVFAKPNGGRYTSHDISCAVYRRSEEAGIKRTSIHGIRRTVSSLLRERLSVDAVASIMGHLPTTNEACYAYDVSTTEVKKNALSAVYSNVFKFEQRKRA